MISFPVSLKVGQKDPYEAVGRGPLNIEFLPCLYDTKGPFGSPTSDSTRTMIRPDTTALLMVFFDFDKYPDSSKYVKEALHLLEKYCNFSAQFIGTI